MYEYVVSFLTAFYTGMFIAVLDLAGIMHALKNNEITRIREEKKYRPLELADPARNMRKSA